MSYRLVVTEKPSVAQSIAKVLKVRNRKEGYLEGNGYFITWCVGHLVGLADAREYDEKYEKWDLKDLPILPDPWKQAVNSGKLKQFRTVKALMSRSDVDVIICATDAGREGELIFRNVYHYAGCRIPFVRLWVSSMEDSAISEGFRNLQPSQNYDALYQSALARSHADWLVGINATRLYTCRYHTLLRIGRVQTPVLAMLTERAEQIEHFQKTPYWNVQLTAEGLTVHREKIQSENEAEELSAKCQNQNLQIISVEKKQKSTPPPRLYDLTSLQRDANRYFGYTAQQTLDAVQSLYEKKLCTYPRTDSQYLTEDMRDTVQNLIRICAQLGLFPSSTDFVPDIDCCINSKKVSDHHALLPTREIYTTDLSTLPEPETNILLQIAMRLLCSTAPVHMYEETVITAKCAEETFSCKGKTVLSSGWKMIEADFRKKAGKSMKMEEEAEPFSSLPKVSENQVLHNVSPEISRHFTSPPKPYTEDTLLSAMENAGKEDFDKDTEKKGLGTPATRAGIIESLVSSGYVKRKGKSLIPTTEGKNLISIVPVPFKSPSMTADWENALLQIEKRTLSADTFIAGITKMVRDLVTSTPSPTAEQPQLFSSSVKTKDSVGVCPWCGSDIYDGKSSYYCSSRECSFCLWKKNKFLECLKQPMTKKLVQELLKKGRIHSKKLYSQRTGKMFEADLVLTRTVDKEGNPTSSIQLDFGKSARK